MCSILALLIFIFAKKNQLLNKFYYFCKLLLILYVVMRFKLTLQLQPEVMGRELPINYQYPLQSAIYKTLAISDAEFSLWLHDNGYQQEGKRFKLFTYSNLFMPCGIDRERERLIPKRNIATWFVSFLPEKGTLEFVRGLFENETIQIADKVSGVQFKVRELQMMPKLDYNPNLVFKTLSPICVSAKNARGKMDYLSPEDERYELALLTGLLARYNALNGHPFAGDAYCHLQVLSKPKSVLVRIKAGTPQETRVRGYHYNFSIDLPPELMTIAYESGLGEKASLGFGMFG